MVTDSLQRTILAVLVDHKETTRSELANKLIADNTIPATDTHSLEIRLHHNHLPRLDGNQYIDYDTRTGDIVLWKEPTQIQCQLTNRE